MPSKDARPPPVMRPEPDYEAVMAQEFRSATAEGTREALIRFIARHPRHALADQARALLDAKPGMPQASPGSTDPDADIYAAFDSARQHNTAAAYRSFIERYAPHPLAEEAQRLQQELTR